MKCTQCSLVSMVKIDNRDYHLNRQGVVSMTIKPVKLSFTLTGTFKGFFAFWGAKLAKIRLWGGFFPTFWRLGGAKDALVRIPRGWAVAPAGLRAPRNP